MFPDFEFLVFKHTFDTLQTLAIKNSPENIFADNLLNTWLPLDLIAVASLISSSL